MITRAGIQDALVEILGELLAAEEAIRSAAGKTDALAARVQDSDGELAEGLRTLAEHAGQVDSADPTIEHARWLVSELLVKRGARAAVAAGAAS